MGNDPANGIDPDGGKTQNPIYSSDGAFRGVDEFGIQGEAIIYDGFFENGMSQNDILNNGGTFLSNWNNSDLFTLTDIYSHLINFQKQDYWVFPQNNNHPTIDNTTQATNHYFKGSGESVNLGLNTLNSLLSSDEFQRVNSLILSGQAKNLNARFDVDMTFRVFHVGNTKVKYNTTCTSSICNTLYELYYKDGYWDPDFIDENMLGIPADGPGPNLERLGGTPYHYISTKVIYSYPNPGYNN